MRARALIVGDNDRSVACDELHVDKSGRSI